MKLLKSITNNSNLLEGYSYDRTPFCAGHTWTRTLLSGAICTGLTAIGVYAGYLAMDKHFADALGDQALNFKITTGAVVATLLGYSLRDLLRSIIRDVKTQMRVARGNSWLTKGTASTLDHASHIHMQQTPLCMVRFVEIEGGLKVYAVAKHHEHPEPILIDTLLLDDEYPALATFYTHEADIRSTLSEACGEWSAAVAGHLGIILGQLTGRTQSGATRISTQLPDEESELGDDFLKSLGNPSALVFGRASAPRIRPGDALRTVTDLPPQAITH